MSENQNHRQALDTLVSVFFFWGFIAASNGVFIPFCKTYFSLDDVSKNTYIVTNWITEKENGRKYGQRIKYVIDRNTGQTVITVSPRMWYDTNQTAAVLFETAGSTIASCVEK